SRCRYLPDLQDLRRSIARRDSSPHSRMWIRQAAGEVPLIELIGSRLAARNLRLSSRSLLLATCCLLLATRCLQLASFSSRLASRNLLLAARFSRLARNK